MSQVLKTSGCACAAMARCNAVAEVADLSTLLTQECNRFACDTYSRVAGPWRACSVECGTGVQSRYVTCVSSRNVPVAASKCTTQLNATVVRALHATIVNNNVMLSFNRRAGRFAPG